MTSVAPATLVNVAHNLALFIESIRPANAIPKAVEESLVEVRVIRTEHIIANANAFDLDAAHKALAGKSLENSRDQLADAIDAARIEREKLVASRDAVKAIIDGATSEEREAAETHLRVQGKLETDYFSARALIAAEIEYARKPKHVEPAWGSGG